METTPDIIAKKIKASGVKTGNVYQPSWWYSESSIFV